MKKQLQVLALIGAGFVLAALVIWLQQPTSPAGGDSPHVSTGTTWLSRLGISAAPQSARATATQAAGAAGSRPAAPAPAEDAAMAAAERAASYEPPPDTAPLPIEVNVERDAGGSIAAVTATSYGDNPLELTVTSDGPGGAHSQVRVKLPPGESSDLTAAGLYASRGYSLRLESPGYLPRMTLVSQ